MSIENMENIEARTYEVGVTINDGYFVAEITPPLGKESNLDEMARIAFLDNDLSLGRTVTSYHPVSTVFAGFFSEYDATQQDTDAQTRKNVGRGIVKLLSPAHSADIIMEFLEQPPSK